MLKTSIKYFVQKSTLEKVQQLPCIKKKLHTQIMLRKDFSNLLKTYNYVHGHIHTYIHAHTHAYTHMHIHTHVHIHAMYYQGRCMLEYAGF